MHQHFDREPDHEHHEEVPAQRPEAAQPAGGGMVEHHPPPTGDHPERHAAPHEAHDTEEFRRRFWVCLVLTIPILIYADLIQQLFHYTAPAFPGSQYLSLAPGIDVTAICSPQYVVHIDR